MRAGVTIWLDRPLDESVTIARAAEDAGFTDVWLPDHYFLKDVFVAQTLIAAATSTIGIGTAVASPMLRHPTLLASAAASVDEVSGGRLTLGLGPGGFEFPTQLRLDMSRPLAMVREAAEIVRALWTGAADLTGRVFSAAGAVLHWRPERTLPVFMAARGPRMLELAGEMADGVIVHGLAGTHLDFVDEQLAVGAVRADRDPGDCAVYVMTDVEVDDDEQAAVDRLRPRCTVMVGGSYTEAMIPRYGLDPAAVAPVRRAVSAGDMTTAAGLLTDDMVRAFAVAGSEKTVAAAFERLEERGVDGIILNVGGDTLDDAVARVYRIGRLLRQEER